MKLVFATNNAHKLQEVRQILGDHFEVKGLADIGCHEDIPETADTLEGNALQKARYVREHYGLDCFADDTGLEVTALGGAPGVHTARYAELAGEGSTHDSQANMRLLLKNLQHQSDRSARFRTVIALTCQGEEHLFEGTVEGRILPAPQGEAGFGYDPVFEPENRGCSFAQMSPADKNAISHRGRATQKLVDFLTKAILCFCILLALPFSGAFAQALGTWQVYPAYTVCTQNIPVGNRIYGLMESKLMAYDTEDESITTFDWLRQLNDVSISYMDYSAAAKRLILVYDNDNIDLLSTEDDNDVINLAHLKNSTLQRKEVSAVCVVGSLAYLATGFGLIVVDMAEGVISKTYQIGLSGSACAVVGDYIYLGTTDSGLWRGRQTDNLQDPANWTQVNTWLRPSRLLAFDGRVWVVHGNNVYMSNAEGTAFSAELTSFKVNFAFVGSDRLLVGNDTQLQIYTAWDQRETVNGTFTWNSLTLQDNVFWASDGEEGLQAYKRDDADGSFRLTTSSIHPNSPLHDYAFHLRRVGDRLLVSGGNRHYNETSRPGTAMLLEPDGTWRNFSTQATAAAFPNEQYLDVTNIAQDPNDSEHHYVGTTRSGIFEFREGKPVAHIGLENSPLQSILPDDANPQWFTVADGLQYDPDGNLWVLNCTQGRADTTIRVMRPDGTWTGIPCPEVQPASTLDNIFFDSKGRAWINSRRMQQRGIFMLDYVGTVANAKDDRRMLRSTIENQDGTTYAPNEFYCITEDQDGYIWFGTNEGPFVITDPANFTANSFTFEQVKVARSDGSGLADYLLSGLPVLSICIDGGNRKWLGTQDNGVYLMSADCQEQIYHFTTENSPLPSDDVYDICIDGRTGLVFFATAGGLCSFAADATSPVEDLDADDVLAYPNPVGPDYNGPIAVRGLSRDCEVKIVSTTGQLVWSGRSNGGLFTWNGCNQRGQRVSSGVYHVVASTSDGGKAVVTRITVIR